MNHDKRQQMLEALGLVDWQLRADGALAEGAHDRPQAVPTADLETPVAAPALEAERLGAQSKAQAQSPTPQQQASAQASTPAGASAAAPEPDARDGEAPPPMTDSAPSSAPWPDDAGADRAAAAEQDMRAAEAPAESLATVAPTRNMDWEALEAWLGEQDHRGAQRPVFGVGARDADVLIVGEAPGASEDAQGVPFVGRAGQLLDRMLAAIGCSRDTNVYITNICKFRPPDNRDPRPGEVAADWPVLERQIELMDPKLVVAVGRVAAQTLLDSKESLAKMRGRLHRYPRRELDVLVTYHPAFLLRSPQQKAKAWVDLKQIAAHIGAARPAA